jgi:outer membrane protein OmpA-like peptidoglycan-associated protein
MTNRYIKIFIIILFCSIYNTESQELLDTNKLKPRFGIFAQYGLGLNFADFKKLPSTESCCGGFENSISPAYRLGILTDIPLDYDYSIGLRLGYGGFTGNFSSNYNTDVVIDNSVQEGIFSHNLNSDISKVDFAALFTYELEKELYISLGPSLSYILNSDYQQWEQIEQPTDRGVFPGEGRVRNNYSGEIDNINSLLYGLDLVFEYQLPLNNKNSYFLVPTLTYSHKFNNLVDNTNWSISELIGGISIKYRTPPAPPPPPPPPIKPIMPDSLPLPQPPPSIDIYLEAVAVDSTGKINKEPELRIEDFVSLNMRPLLNYVFFDDSSSVIPKRYNLINNINTSDFEIDNLKGKNAIETYYDVMNIVGKRMKDNLSTNITLIGCNSNLGKEKNNKSLSYDRANSVKNYLVNTWGIESDRIKLTARNLPIDASKSDTIPGQEENRRVEIIASDDVITKPVITNDTLRVLSDTNVEFLTDVDSKVGISEWLLEVSQDGNNLFQKIGNGQPDSKIPWELRNNSKDMPRSASPVVYKLTVKDSVGQKNYKEKSLPISKLTVNAKRENRTSDKEFEYYSLILFSYGKSSLEKEHRDVVDFVKNRIKDDAQVYIYGYSDSMGDEDINKVISERRAKSVANRLRLRDAIIKGVGEENLLYNNRLPEGRFYCRTVQITVETPVKDSSDKNG